MPINDNDKEFQKRLLAAFKVETQEHLKALSEGLIELEKAPPANREVEILETIYREAHSLKGSARAVNRAEIESICQSLEEVLAQLKRGELKPWPAMFDTLYHAIDTIEQLLSSPEGVKISELIEKLSQMSSGEDREPARAAVQPAEVRSEKDLKAKKESVEPVVSETVRISLSKLDQLFRQTEEMLSAKQMTGQRVAEIQDVLVMIRQWKRQWTKVHLGTGRLGNPLTTKSEIQDVQASNLSEFIDWSLPHVKSIENRLWGLEKSARHDHRSIGAMVDDLLENMKETLMVPFTTLLEILPRMVRDLSRDKGKEVRLDTKGGEIETDRRVLEEMREPLIHLIRNGIDHGIEKPEERARFNKSPEGTVTVAITQAEGNIVEMLISDDGAGIDLVAVKKAALMRGIMSEEELEKLGEQKCLSLIFQSEVSTSPIITDLSGRGLGLAIVQERVQRVGGRISVETHLHQGTAFRILLPVTLATFRGVLVRTAGRLFMAPTAHVDRAIRVKPDEIKTVENKETVSIEGSTVSLVRLDDVLEIPRTEMHVHGPQTVALVLGAGENRIAFGVDEVLNEQDGLVKGLGNQLSRVRNIAGATILGSGEVVPILNIPDVMKSAVKVTAAPVRRALSTEEAEAETKSVLVVEDSITARMLLKNILESAGYDVKTAIDGVDAFTSLKEGTFDLVVSDVEMPRMNGFDLSSKVRSDKKLKEIPIILVTALESREDRERGIEVGADAYIVKSSFDQSNLLDTVRRLV